MLRIRKAIVEDVPLLHAMILEFAEFEKLREQVTITKESIERDGFGEKARFQTLIADWDGKPAGYAIYFVFYSSFEGPGLFLEDVYVREAFRGKGIGKALMAEVAALALREGFWAVRWDVLDWNRPAIEFYQRMGAIFLDEWKSVRIEGDALRTLAADAPGITD
jgi:GNAT superfamily N-acetyltransferase